MDDEIKVKVVEEESIHINITEETPIIVQIDGGGSSYDFSDIFSPDEDGKRITKMYIKNGKLKVKYEDGE